MGASPGELGFGEAFDELKRIADRLNGEQLSVDELVELVRRGKALERALRTHLDEVEQEVEAIERGEGVEELRIVAGETASKDTKRSPGGGGGPARSGGSSGT